MVSIIIGFISLTVIRILSPNTKKEKCLNYGNYSINYVQYSKGKKYLRPGHYLYNKDLLNQAYMILANRLLDEYLRTKDARLPKEILKISNDYNLIYDIKIDNFDSLIINRKYLLDTMILID